jgi:hypothetical protein
MLLNIINSIIESLDTESVCCKQYIVEITERLLMVSKSVNETF